MEDWFREGATSEFEEGEVVRGRVVQVTPTEVLVDVGYKSEGAIPIEEFHRHGKLPKVGDQIEVYLEAKERSEEHTSELQSLAYLVCRLLLEKKKKKTKQRTPVTIHQQRQTPIP